MRVHLLQHVPFEGSGSIQQWLERRFASVSICRPYEGAGLPGVADFDWLIIMGGPMSVNDEQDHPWLRPEKLLIKEAVISGRVVLGICLGAQLIASALGARVSPNPRKEIGWFPVRRCPQETPAAVAGLFPDSTEVFHWHGDTFALPPGAVRFLSSDACENQAFAIGNRVIGLQFHLEITMPGARLLIENCAREIVSGPTIQSEAQMLSRPERFDRINRLMSAVLETLAT